MDRPLGEREIGYQISVSIFTALLAFASIAIRYSSLQVVIEMALTILALFMTGMWVMILTVAAFLVIFVALPRYVLVWWPRREVNHICNTAIAIIVVIVLVLVKQIKEDLSAQKAPTVKHCF